MGDFQIVVSLINPFLSSDGGGFKLIPKWWAWHNAWDAPGVKGFTFVWALFHVCVTICKVGVDGTVMPGAKSVV